MRPSTTTCSPTRSSCDTRCRRRTAPAATARSTSRASKTSRGITQTGRASRPVTRCSSRDSSRCSSGVQPSVTSSTPTERSTSITCGAMPSPQHLSRGKSARSSSRTRRSGDSARAPSAVAAPAGPAPTTTRSQVSCCSPRGRFIPPTYRAGVCRSQPLAPNCSTRMTSRRTPASPSRRSAKLANPAGAADVGPLDPVHERPDLLDVRRGGHPVAEVLAGERHEGARVAELRGVRQVGERPADRDDAEPVAQPVPGGVPQHRDERHHAGAAGHADGLGLALPGEPAADRPAQLEDVADLGHVVQVARDLAAGQALDHQLDQRVVGLRGDRVGALRGVVVRSAQPHDVVLPRQVVDPVRDVEPHLHEPVADPLELDDLPGRPGRVRLAHGSPW